MEKKITEILRELGIPMGNLGFGYITEAVLLVMEDKNYLRGIMKPDGLYAVVAWKNGTDGSRVERAIRHAIEYCFTHADGALIAKYFGHVDTGAKLTNKNFIAALANEVAMVEAETPPSTNDTKDTYVRLPASVKRVSDCTNEELITELFNRMKN